MKILFTHSYFLRFDPKQWEAGKPYAPLGTIYAAALLREEGHQVKLFDTMFESKAENIASVISAWKPDLLVIYDDGFNYLTKMCLTNMREAAFNMMAIAKKESCLVAVSGSDAADHADAYLQAGADYVLAGEGEMTLLELANAIQSGHTDAEQIAGLMFWKNGWVVRTAARPLIKNLDALPLPAWDLINIEDYRSRWIKSSGYFSMNMVTTRGCPFKCNWCAKPIYGNRYHARSPMHVAGELALLIERYQPDHIWFCDDIFGLKPGWVSEFSHCLHERNLKIKFKIQCRADLLVETNTVRQLAEAGCENVWLGAESGSQRILDAMDKGITIDQIYKSTSLLKEHGIKPSLFIQFGYSGETKEDIQRTLHMIHDLLPHEIGISVSYPLPGTVFYERVRAELVEKANWTDSDDLSLMFRNTYPSDFYKRLHRYVHHYFHRIKAAEKLKRLMRHPASVDGLALRQLLRLPAYLAFEWISKPSLKTTTAHAAGIPI